MRKCFSRDGTISCASCHQADAAFTDRLPVSIGIDGRRGDRNAMPLFNLAWKREFFWDGRARSLREQVLMPIEDHREMDESLDRVCEKLTQSPDYPALFRAAFASPGITPEKIALALEQFLLTLSARDSRFDRAMSGKATLSDEEKRGFELFMTEYEPRTGQRGADCFHCHGGALFSDHQFHNNGLGGDAPGRAQVTGLPGDRAQIRHAQPAQHRSHRALHARRPLRHARGSRRALQHRHPPQRHARSEPRQTSRKPDFI